MTMETEDYDDIAKIQYVLECIKSGRNEDISNVAEQNKRKDTSTSGNLRDENVARLLLLEQCLECNVTCQKLLASMEVRLLYLQEACKTEALRVEEAINRVDNKNKVSTTFSPLHCTLLFGMPYFKDKSFYPCPNNRDYRERRAQGYFDVNFMSVNARVWTPDEKKVLTNCIESCEVTRGIERNEFLIKQIKRKMKGSNDPLEINKFESQLKECNSNISTVKTANLRELVGSRRDDYDWLKISNIDLKGIHSPVECCAMWQNYLHPEINKSVWLKVEDEALKQLAKKHSFQDWDAIAKELNTNRSGYQCMIHFQMRINGEILSKWTEREDKHLEELVRCFQIGNFVPWSKIAWHMNGRTRSQVYQRWCYSIDTDIKKGRFTKDEDALIVAGVSKFGIDYKHLSTYFPGRTSVQLRQRIHTLLLNKEPTARWTPDDDILLLKLAKLYSPDWKRVSQHFMHRSNNQVRCRYGVIKRWLEKNPGNNYSRLYSREYKKDIKKLWDRVQHMLDEDDNSGSAGKSEITKASLAELQNKLLTMKRGRKAGQKKPVTTVDLQFMNYFRCAYSQRGRKGKSTCSRSIVPELARQTKLMLSLMKAKLNLPLNSEIVVGDDSLVKADKYVLKYLIENECASASIRPNNVSEDVKSSHGSRIAALGDGEDSKEKVCVKVDFGASPSDSVDSESLGSSVVTTESASFKPTVNNQSQSVKRDIVYMCPPNFTTLVGFRTLLLSRRSLKNELRRYEYRTTNGKLSNEEIDLTVGNESLSDSIQCSEVKAEVQEAERLWKERLASLFTWPAYMSNVRRTGGEDLYSDIVVKKKYGSNGDKVKKKYSLLQNLDSSPPKVIRTLEEEEEEEEEEDDEVQSTTKRRKVGRK